MHRAKALHHTGDTPVNRCIALPIAAALLAFCLLLAPVAPASTNDLHKAARTGDMEAVDELLAAGANVDATDGEGETALHKAAKADHVDVVDKLLAAGADPLVSGMGPFGATGTPLHVAAKFGRVESLQALLDAGIDPNLADPGVGTPLHLALRAGRQQAVALLRAAGAGPVAAPPVDTMIAAADPELGRSIANTCQLCHQMDLQPRPDQVAGPTLWNIVGRPKASVEGYDYSDPMAALDGVWSFADLNSLIVDARLFVPGTKMDGVAGIATAERRAALLRYLRDLADDPVPLPE
jgi:cytochrome c